MANYQYMMSAEDVAKELNCSELECGGKVILVCDTICI